MKKIINFLLGELLFLAKGNPCNVRFDYGDKKKVFYAIQAEIMDKYGTLLTKHQQTIINECYYCEKGVFKGFDNGYCWVPRMPQECNRCGGTGRHSTTRTCLIRFKVGRQYFHHFAGAVSNYWGTFSSYYPHLKIGEEISERIKHPKINNTFSREANLLLLLFFERKYFIKELQSVLLSHHTYPLLPLTFINYIVYNFQNRWTKSWWWKQKLPKQLFKTPVFQDDDDLPF